MNIETISQYHNLIIPGKMCIHDDVCANTIVFYIDINLIKEYMSSKTGINRPLFGYKINSERRTTQNNNIHHGSSGKYELERL